MVYVFGAGACVEFMNIVYHFFFLCRWVHHSVISFFMGKWYHYDGIIMGTMEYEITSLKSVYSNVYSGADQSKHQSSATLAFVWWIQRGPGNSLRKWPVTQKMFPFDDVTMITIVFPYLTLKYYKLDLLQSCVLQYVTYKLTTTKLKCSSEFESTKKRPIPSQIAKLMGPTWDPPGSCRPQMGPMLAPWTLLSGLPSVASYRVSIASIWEKIDSVIMALHCTWLLRFPVVCFTKEVNLQ